MWSFSNAGAFVNAEHTFFAIVPRSTVVRGGSTWKDPIYFIKQD